MDSLAFSPYALDALTFLRPPLTVFAGVLGLIVGSFLNVVIYRVPAGLSVVTPRSACPKCDTPIRALDNIPVLSWLVLRGRCRTCTEPISARYPAVEATTAALFAGLTWWGIGAAPALVPALLFAAAIGVALFLIDLDTFRLPDRIVLPAYPVMALLLVLAGALSAHWPVATVALSALFWGVAFAAPYYLTRGRGMGFGDVKLAPVLGALLGAFGWGPSLVGWMGGFVFGTIFSVILMARGKAGRKTKVPYGPFMLLGALFGVLFGDAVFGLYLRVSGLA